jgi:hypothetical protein
LDLILILKFNYLYINNWILFYYYINNIFIIYLFIKKIKYKKFEIKLLIKFQINYIKKKIYFLKI